MLRVDGVGEHLDGMAPNAVGANPAENGGRVRLEDGFEQAAEFAAGGHQGRKAAAIGGGTAHSQPVVVLLAVVEGHQLRGFVQAAPLIPAGVVHKAARDLGAKEVGQMLHVLDGGGAGALDELSLLGVGRRGGQLGRGAHGDFRLGAMLRGTALNHDDGMGRNLARSLSRDDGEIVGPVRQSPPVQQDPLPGAIQASPSLRGLRTICRPFWKISKATSGVPPADPEYSRKKRRATAPGPPGTTPSKAGMTLLQASWNAPSGGASSPAGFTPLTSARLLIPMPSSGGATVKAFVVAL